MQQPTHEGPVYQLCIFHIAIKRVKVEARTAHIVPGRRSHVTSRYQYAASYGDIVKLSTSEWCCYVFLRLSGWPLPLLYESMPTCVLTFAFFQPKPSGLFGFVQFFFNPASQFCLHELISLQRAGKNEKAAKSIKPIFSKFCNCLLYAGMLTRPTASRPSQGHITN